jgi:hypothetical protein
MEKIEAAADNFEKAFKPSICWKILITLVPRGECTLRKIGSTLFNCWQQ